MARELHVADDVGAERAGGVRERGAAEAGVKFFGDGGATDLGAAFEDEGLESGFGKIEGGDEAVVSGADDDDVARISHRYFCPSLLRLRLHPPFAKYAKDGAPAFVGHPVIFLRGALCLAAGLPIFQNFKRG